MNGMNRGSLLRGRGRSILGIFYATKIYGILLNCMNFNEDIGNKRDSDKPANKKVSKIKKYHIYKMQTNPWHR